MQNNYKQVYDDFVYTRQDELEFLSDLFGVDHDELTEDDMNDLYGHKVA